MSDDREREISRPSLADAIDLLDLVRSTEDSARISTESPAPVTPSVPPEARISAPPPSAQRTIPPAPPEEFVDVGSDAIDLPPSIPPTKLQRDSRPNPPVTITLPKPKPVPAAPSPEPSTAMPPAVSIVLVLGLAIGCLYAILALPSEAKPAQPQNLRAEPPNLQLERRPQ